MERLYVLGRELCTYNRDDAIKIMKTLYTSFQYIDDCHQHLTICTLYTYNISMLDPDDVGKKKNFVEKMITFRINQFRLQVQTACLRHNGYVFRVIRPRGEGEGKDKCVPKYLFDWMIIHKEPTDDIKEKYKKKRGNVASSNRRNSVCYKSKEYTEQDLMKEVENIDALRETYMNKIAEIRKKHVRKEGKYIVILLV